MARNNPPTHPANPANPGESKRMCEVALAALEDAKGEQIRRLDVRKLTDVTDYMLVVTGASDRHVRTLAERVLEKMRAAGWKHLGMEGEQGRDWVLVDFVDVVVHIMRAQTRERYDLESLWEKTLGELPGPGPETQGNTEPGDAEPGDAEPDQRAAAT